MKKRSIKKMRPWPVWFWVICMTAGGGCSVGISRAGVPPFYVEIPSREEEHLLPNGKSAVQQIEDRLNQSFSIVKGSGKEVIADGTGNALHKDLGLFMIGADSPGRLNSAYYYDEGASEDDVSQSVAGRIYRILWERDSEWIHAIYRLGQISPENMAARLGTSIPEGVEWNRISVTFRNGDSTPISGYSNAKEILSLVSVYAYYHQREDQSFFQSYGDWLWNRSHSYNMSMSDVYYCQGACQYLEKELEDEWLMEEPVSQELQEEILIQGDDSWNDESGNQTGGAVIGQDGRSETADESSEAIIETGANESSESAVETGADETGKLTAGTGTGETSESAAETGTDETSELAVETSDSENNQAVIQTATSSNAERSLSYEEKRGSTCQGHVDLNISVRIIGLKEKRNLYQFDSVERNSDTEGSQWNGWDETAMAYAQAIADQDWYAQYGLTGASSKYVRNPLSASEVNGYLNMLPPGTSSERQEVVKQALMSVGCIPYYWGGKPSQGGYEGNHFGAIVSADEDGRILKGLDCSGWINWVYWTAFGSPLPYESTAGLVNCGKGISKEELQAGDILIRGGEDRHVYMFLAWADDGSMFLIHETTGTINNVTINTYDLDLQYYRSLITD